MACYRKIYEEKKKAIVQSSFDKFVRKAERPPLPHVHGHPPPSVSQIALRLRYKM
jgi:hypothetical protein